MILGGLGRSLIGENACLIWFSMHYKLISSTV